MQIENSNSVFRITRQTCPQSIGPETASRILGKMHPQEEQVYLDLLKAKIQYLRTREFWDK